MCRSFALTAVHRVKDSAGASSHTPQKNRKIEVQRLPSHGLSPALGVTELPACIVTGACVHLCISQTHSLKNEIIIKKSKPLHCPAQTKDGKFQPERDLIKLQTMEKGLLD